VGEGKGVGVRTGLAFYIWGIVTPNTGLPVRRGSEKFPGKRKRDTIPVKSPSKRRRQATCGGGVEGPFQRQDWRGLQEEKKKKLHTTTKIWKKRRCKKSGSNTYWFPK